MKMEMKMSNTFIQKPENFLRESYCENHQKFMNFNTNKKQSKIPA